MTLAPAPSRPSPRLRRLLGTQPPRDVRPEPRAVDVDVAEALPRVLRIVGSVVAPTTLLTGLLFYFGRLHITGMFRHLRVNFTVLDLSFQDYLIRSADGLFVPLAAAAGVVLLLLWVHGFVARSLPVSARRAVAPLSALLGLVLLAVAVAGLAGSAAFASAPEAPGLCLAVGVLLLAYGMRLSRRGPPAAATAVAEWGAVFVVVAVGLFWAVGSYAIGVGATRGQQIERSLSGAPDVVLYSEQDLNLVDPGVTETVCQDAEAAYAYRYDGLKLVLQSGDQYLFLPEGWTRSSGAAILLPRTDTLRLEFTAPGAAGDVAC